MIRHHLVHHLVALKLLVMDESMAMAQDSFNESISNEMNDKKRPYFGLQQNNDDDNIADSSESLINQ